MPVFMCLLTTIAAPVAATAAPTPSAIEPHPHFDDDVLDVELTVFSFSTLAEVADHNDEGLNPEVAGGVCSLALPERFLVSSEVAAGGVSAFQAAAAGRYVETREYAPEAFCANPVTRSYAACVKIELFSPK